MIKVGAFRWVPPFAQGVVRDLRVRWALEESGLPYEERLIGPEDKQSASYRSLQPFGQVPSFEEDGLKLFESGAIVLHLAERSDALLPADPDGRARARTWMFAALNSVEPPAQMLAEIDFPGPGEDWSPQARAMMVEAVTRRLTDLAAWMEGREYLEDRFTAGDLLMTTVLRILRHTSIVAGYPGLDAYRLRCEARPAFQRALAAQMETFAAHAPAGS